MTDNFIARINSDGRIQPVNEHLIKVAELCRERASKIGVGSFAYLIGLFHDIGKYSDQFKQYILSNHDDTDFTSLNEDEEEDFSTINIGSAKRGDIDHSTSGSQYIYRRLKEKAGIFSAQIASLCIASHHNSTLIDCLKPDGTDEFSRRMEKGDNLTHLSEALANMPFQLKEDINLALDNEELLNELRSFIKTITCTCDQKIVHMRIGLLLRFLFSCLVDADRNDAASFEMIDDKSRIQHTNDVSWDELINLFESYIGKFTQDSRINEIRMEVANYCLAASSLGRGIFRLTVPTGGGKTLSSLRFALHHANTHGMDRIIYVVPFNTIIEQNADTVRKIFAVCGDIDSILLEHHSNLSPEEKTAKHQMLCETWNAKIVFTSLVHLMESVFSASAKSARRMHALANSVIIFDEVQSIPIKCVHLFNTAVQFFASCFNSTIVLCTATQPLLHEIEPVSRAMPVDLKRQIIPDENSLYKKLRRVNAQYIPKNGGWTVDEISEFAIKITEDAHTTLVVVNTKEQARQLYAAIKRKSSEEVVHLSTDMCPEHRLKVINRVRTILDENLKNERAGLQDGMRKLICVSTQLIEAGVDIDFGTAIRYLAGLSNIVQTAGRCNRNGKHKMGTIYILNPSDEKLGNLTEIKSGIEITRRVLNDYEKDPSMFDNDLLGQKSLEWYYKCYFYDRQGLMKYPVGSDSPIGRKDDLFELLSTNDISLACYCQKNDDRSPVYPLRQSFCSASKAFKVIDDATCSVLVPYKRGTEIIKLLCSSRFFEFEKKLLIEAQRYTVNLYPNTFDDLHRKGAIHEVQEGTGVLYLDNHHYDDELGVSIEGIVMETMNL